LVLKVYYTRNAYTVVTGRNNISAGTVTGGGTYAYGKTITLIANTNTGYTFLGWYEKEALVSLNAAYTVTATANITYEARWQANTYTVSVNKNIPAAGYVSGVGNYVYGSYVTVSATTYTGYVFLGWYENGSKVSSYQDYGFVLSDGDKFLEARWKLTPYTGNESYYNDFQGIDLSRPDYDYDGDGWNDSHAMVKDDGFKSDLGKGNVAVYDPKDDSNIVWKIPMGKTMAGVDNTNNLNQALGISPSYTIYSNLLLEWELYVPTGATGRVQYQFVTTESGWIELFNLDVNNAQIVSGSGWMATAGKGMTMTRDEWHSIGYALNMVTGDWELFLDGEFIAFGHLNCTNITVKTGYIIMGKVQTGYTGKGYILMDDIKIGGGLKPDGAIGGLDSFEPSWYEQDFEEFEDGENISELFPNRASKNGEYEDQFVAGVDGNKVWKREIDAKFNDSWTYLNTPLLSYKFSEAIVIEVSYYLPTGATGYFVAQGFGANVPNPGTPNSSWMHLFGVSVTDGKICGHTYNDGYYIIDEDVLTLPRDTCFTVTYLLDMNLSNFELYVDGELGMTGRLSGGCTDITFSEGYFDVCNTIYLDEYPPEEGSYIYVDDISITKFTGQIADYFQNK
ncbi:MAG: InlB B-repeat-containing protein, partial [Clostridia bacterium]|nr:InlB B-repeat-containing protein [Clostridia bacterium]